MSRDTSGAGQVSVVTREVDSLIPYAKNARTHTEAQVAQIAASIREFGFNNPILTHGDGIVAGHGRLLAARKLGLATVPTIDLAHLTATQARAYVLADNQLALLAGWDSEMLALELLDLKAEGLDLDLLGFPDVTALLAAASPGGLLPGVDEDAVPPAPTVAVTQPGEVVTLGRHRLMCGDCLQPDQLTLLMAGAQASMVWTDPPYNVAYEGATEDKLTIQNDSMPSEQFREFLRSAFTALLGVTAEGGAFYVAHSDSEGENFRGALREAGWLVKQCLVWVKNSLVLGRQDYQWRHEPILYGWKPGASHCWWGDRCQTTVLEFPRPQRNAEHPTMKPVELVAYCIGNSSGVGQVVLDGFAGSGTTLIAAEKLSRTAYLMELDPIYCDVIVARWEQATGQKAVRHG